MFMGIMGNPGGNPDHSSTDQDRRTKLFFQTLIFE